MSFENMGEAKAAVAAVYSKLDEVNDGLLHVQTLAQEALALAAVLDGAGAEGEQAQALASFVAQQIETTLGANAQASQQTETYQTQV